MQRLFQGKRQKINQATWERTPTFNFFRGFTEPYHGVCIRVDCTATYRCAKQFSYSVFLSMVHRALVAAQRVENFRTRIVEGEPWLYEQVHGGSAVGRPNGTIGFAYYSYFDSLSQFVKAAAPEVERVQQRNDIERSPDPNIIRFSTLPWLDFTSLSHARNFGVEDSAPFVTFGKITEASDRRTMPVSIHAHHALADGLHVAQFVEHFQAALDSPESEHG